MKLTLPWQKQPVAPLAQPVPFKTVPSVFGTDFMPPMDAYPELKRAEILARTFQRQGPKPKKNGTYGLDSKGMDSGMITSFTAGQFGVPDAQLGWYAGQGFIGYQICAMLAQNWLVDKAVTMPAKDAVRNGFELSASDGKELPADVLDEITKLDRKFKLNQNMVEFLRMSGIFGIRVAMFQVDTPNPNKYYSLPFNIDSVKPGSYRGISQIDPYWIAPILDTSAASNPSAIDFYEPTWWLINGMQVHKSHLVIGIPNPVADVIKPSYLYGGVSTVQKIYERVYAAERTANEAPQLAMSKRTMVFYTDLAQAIAKQPEFEERMGWWSRMWNNFGVKIAGEGDKVEQHDTSLADLDAVIMTQYQLVAAAANVPATKLLGTQPKGFNSTGEFEEASYHEFLSSLQADQLTPLVNRHHELLIKSHIMPKHKELGDFAVDIAWRPLDEPTAQEVAETNRIKAETGAALVNSGALDPAEERQRIINDPKSGYNGLSLELEEEANGEEA